MVSTLPSYLFKRAQIWYFRQRTPRHLVAHIGKTEFKVSLKTQDIYVAKRRSISLAFSLQQYFSKYEKKFMTKKVHDDEQFTQLITVSESKVGDITFPAVTFDLDDPKAEAEAFLSYMTMIEGHKSKSDDSTPQESPSPINEGVLLSEAIGEYLALKRDANNIHEHIDEKSVSAIEGKLRRLIDIFDDVPVDSLVLKDAERYRNTLLRLPANINKLAKYRGLSIEEILQSKPEKTMAISTAKSYIEAVSTFYKWCKKNRYVPDNPFEGLRVRKPKDAKSKSEERDPWYESQLETLFSHKIFTQHKALHPHYYWLPLIALYTGARMNEICQLYVDDIVEDDGVKLFKFCEDRPDQKLKNENSHRVVPIHSELIRLGFLIYVESIKELGHPRLFNALTNTRDGYSKNVSTWFGRFRKKLEINVEGKKQDFHSFRHNVSDFYKQSDNAREVDAAAILGHADQMITFGRYGKNLEAKKLKRIIEQLDFRDALRNVKPWPSK